MEVAIALAEEVLIADTSDAIGWVADGAMDGIIEAIKGLNGHVAKLMLPNWYVAPTVIPVNTIAFTLVNDV